MFTGIVAGMVELKSKIESSESSNLSFGIPLDIDDLILGESISINGVCLTISRADIKNSEMFFDVMGVTLSSTNLGLLKIGDLANYEFPLRPVDRLGGHIVQGHVDCTVKLIERRNLDHWSILKFEKPEPLQSYLVNKGAITLNGVSLTLSSVDAHTFEVSLIPTTLEMTNLGQLTVGSVVNVEVDIIAKYVENIMRNYK
jgi:riboflavin synthase